MTPLDPHNFNCIMGDISGESAGHTRIGMFSASRSCVQILATCGHALSCCTLRWWSWMNGTTMGLRISFHGITAFKMASIKCTCVRGPYHNPTTTMGHSIHNVDISKLLTLTMLSTTFTCPKSGLICEDNCSKQTPQKVSISPSKSVLMRNCIWPQWGRRGYRRSSLRWFLAVCGDVFWSVKPIVVAAVQTAGLKPSWRWRCCMRRSWANVVKHGLRLVGLHSSLKCLWRQLMVDKWSSQACGWHALCDKTAPGRVILFCRPPMASCAIIMPHFWGGWIN